jgi:hypothetical protein
MTPAKNQKFASVALAATSRMALALGGRRLGDLVGEAKGEAYMLALDDVPCWAVSIVERKWYRGECGKDYDYSFPPAPAIFRELAREEQYAIRWKRTQLQRMLEAVAANSR